MDSDEKLLVVKKLMTEYTMRIKGADERVRDFVRVKSGILQQIRDVLEIAPRTERSYEWATSKKKQVEKLKDEVKELKAKPKKAGKKTETNTPTETRIALRGGKEWMEVKRQVSEYFKTNKKDGYESADEFALYATQDEIDSILRP